MFLSNQSRVHIYIHIYACAGTEERKTRSWPLRAVRLLNSTPGVSRLLTRAFPPPLATRWRQASPQLDQTPPRVFPPPQHQTRIREWWRGDRGVAIRPPPALMVILPRIVKHAYPCGQVRKLQWKHRDTSSLSLLFLSHWYDRFFFFYTTPWNEKQKTADAGIISFSSVVVPLNIFGEIFSKSQRFVYLFERTSPSRSEFVDSGTTQREYLKRISVAWHFESKRQMLREIGDKRFNTAAISLRRFMSVCLNE